MINDLDSLSMYNVNHRSVVKELSVVVMHSSKDAQNHEIYNLKLKYLLLPKNID